MPSTKSLAKFKPLSITLTAQSTTLFKVGTFTPIDSTSAKRARKLSSRELQTQP